MCGLLFSYTYLHAYTKYDFQSQISRHVGLVVVSSYAHMLGKSKRMRSLRFTTATHTYARKNTCVCCVVFYYQFRYPYPVYMALAMRKRAFFPNVFPAIVLQLSRIMRRRSCHHHTLLLLLYCIDELYIQNTHTHRHTWPLT